MESVVGEKKKTRKSPGADWKLITAEVLRLRDAIKAGRLSERADINKVNGESRILLWRINDMLDTVIQPLNVTAKYLGDMTKGKIPPTINENYQGELDAVRKGLNAMIVRMTPSKVQADGNTESPVRDEGTKKSAANILKRLLKVLGMSLTAIIVILLLSGSARSQSFPRFSGSVFGDYYYDIRNHLPANKDMQAFDYRRIYVGVEDTLSPRVSGTFVAESNPVFTNSAISDLGLDVKYAFLTLNKVLIGSDVRFGIQPTPIIQAADAIFGYRSLENSMEDLHGISDVNNFGVSVSSSLSTSVSAVFMVGNNCSNGLWTNRYKIAFAQFSFRPFRNFVAVISGDYAGAPSREYSRTGDIILDYSTSWFSVGGEAFVQDIDHNAYAGTIAAEGTSQTYGAGFDGWVSLVRDLRFMARCDYWNPRNAFGDVSTNPLDNTWTMLIAGLDYRYSQNIHFIPNLMDTTYGLPGSQPDITARVTLYLIY